MADHMQKTGEKLLRRSIGGLGEHMVHMGTGSQKCCSSEWLPAAHPWHHRGKLSSGGTLLVRSLQHSQLTGVCRGMSLISAPEKNRVMQSEGWVKLKRKEFSSCRLCVHSVEWSGKKRRVVDLLLFLLSWGCCFGSVLLCVAQQACDAASVSGEVWQFPGKMEYLLMCSVILDKLQNVELLHVVPQQLLLGSQPCRRLLKCVVVAARTGRIIHCSHWLLHNWFICSLLGCVSHLMLHRFPKEVQLLAISSPRKCLEKGSFSFLTPTVFQHLVWQLLESQLQGLGPQSCRLARDIQSIMGCWQEEDSSDGDEMAFLYRKSKERNGNWAGLAFHLLFLSTVKHSLFTNCSATGSYGCGGRAVGGELWTVLVSDRGRCERRRPGRWLWMCREP